MKTLMYLFLVAILVIAGCAKDDIFVENPERMELKKAKVPIPFKADLNAVADLNSDLLLVEGLNPNDPGSYSYSKMLLNGTATHMGKINPEKSYYTFDKFVFFMEDGHPFTLNTGTGILVGANGDGIEFTFEIKQSAINFSFTGTNKIIPGTGTGKFEGCTGTVYSVGGLSEDGTLWSKNEGYLVYE